jgi:outer membrane protein assembly factor BamD
LRFENSNLIFKIYSTHFYLQLEELVDLGVLIMRFNRIKFIVPVACTMLFLFLVVPIRGQQPQPSQQRARTQSEGTPAQRLNVMWSRLDAMRRQLNTAIAALNANDRGGQSETRSADDPGTRLRALENEVSSVLSEVSNLRSRQERAERYDITELDRLEGAVSDLNERTQAMLRATATETRAAAISGEEARPTSGGNANRGERRGFFGRLLGRGGNNRYEELTGTVAPGRDRVLFEEATRETRRGRYETARLLFNVIVTAYSDSPYLPLAKLAIGDTFYLEGGSTNLIQASAAYREWLTFFPTHPLADDVMLKMAEAEMRQMGLADRDTSHARKAEQQLLVLLQQFPNTTLRPEVNARLREVQENLAMHNLQVANFYYDRFTRGVAPNARGAQSRLREIVERFPNFSYRDEALFRLGVTYIQEEEPDEAARYFQELLRNHPNSEFAARAREQLETIGAPVPQPDPARLNEARPERPSLTSRVITQIIGSTPLTIRRDGVLINRDGEDGDLIAEAIRNNGQLQNNQTPSPSDFRRPPARRVVQPEAPTSTRPTTTGGGGSGVSVRPTQSGQPTGSNNTTASPQTAPTTVPTQSAPATTTPSPAPSPSTSPATRP